MSLKDLFESTKVTKSGSADETAYEVESEAYTDAFVQDKNEYVPPVDFSTASNFAKYGSAAKYYEDSIQRIYSNYPYDGSKYEVLDFHNSSSYLDRWMLEYKYPRTTGYVELGTTSGSGDWLPMVSGSADGDPATATFTFSDKPNEESWIELTDTDGTTVRFEIDNEADGAKKASATFTFSDKPNEESWIQLVDTDGTTIRFEIDNENDGLKKSTATFTFSDKPNEGSTITVVDSDGTSVTFELDNENDGVTGSNVALNGIYAAGGGATGTATDLVAKINAQSALDIVATNPSSGVVLLTQGTGGRDGNTTITLNDSAHWDTSTSVNVPTAFAGGAADVALSGISAAGGGAAGTAADLVAKVNAQSSLNIVATNPSSGVVLLTQGTTGGGGDTAITLNNSSHWNTCTSTNVPAKFTDGSGHGAEVGGWGMPDTSDNNILEYIEIKGGPHTGSADRTFETQDVKLKELFKFSNVYDSGSAREYSLEYNLATGMTVEFWMLKNGFYTSKTEREVVFDLWNNENSSSAGYGRLMIELSGTNVSGESVIRLTAQSGTNGFINEGIATITTDDVADGIWKHYAITLKNHPDNDGVNAKLYINGQVSGSAKLGSTGLGRVTGSMLANIGALVARPNGTNGYYDKTSIAKGGAKLSASLDEFRFWKLERDPRQIGRYWFTQVGGGSNTDTANVGLGVYYKFNEGIMNSGSRDRTILDYSGRISNGFWKGGVAECRNSGSAIASGSHNRSEFHDPIIYSEHPDVEYLETSMIVSGAHHDNLNNSLITSNFPDWIDTESRTTTLKHFTQIFASYFDKLYMQIEGLSKIKERYGSSYASGDVSASFKPVPFAKSLVTQFGIAVPEILQEAELIENFLNRNETMEYEEKLYNIRNQIYSNIYANLLYVFKTKGTEKSLRNMLRCFGVDDELVKINAYADNGDYVFKDNRRSTTNKTNYVTFNHSDRNDGTVYQAVSMSVDGVYSNPNARGYITGSSTFGKYNAQTIECEVFFPLKTDDILSKYWYQDRFVTASLFGTMGHAGADHDGVHDTRFPASSHAASGHHSGTVDLKVFALKDKLESTRARFMMSSSVLGTLTSDYYEDVYDDTRWNFAVRIKPTSHPWMDHAKVEADMGGGWTQGFDVEFYGVNVFTDVVQHEFLKTRTITETVGEAFLSAPKRCYVGALHQDFTGSTLFYSNAEVGNLRYWMSDISDEVVRTHAMDQSSYGVESPYKNAFIYQTSMSGNYVPQIATLALHWNFDNVTGSGGSPTTTQNTKDAQFIVQDVSSGSAEHGERYEPNFSDQVMMQHLGIGDFFLDNKTDIVNTRYVTTGKVVLPEYLHSNDMVEIRQRDTEFFTMETRPSKVYYSIEKSMYQTISEEMVKMFSTIKDFDNLIGEPVNRYRHEYKDLGKLRQLFFEKMPNDPDLDKYVDYYKWIDSAVSRFLEDLFPASAEHSDGMQTMVESHMLERSKYQTKYPTMEMAQDPPAASFDTINTLLYDYQRGSAPLPGDIHSISATEEGTTGSAEMMDQDQNCLWWSKRAEREHPILASTAMSASSPGMNLSGTLTSRIAVFSASTSAYNRKLHTPYHYSVVQNHLIHGGINYDDNKKLDYVYPATVPFSPRAVDYGKFGGYPLGYLIAKDMDRDASPYTSMRQCDLPLSSSYGAKVKREGYKVIDGWEGFKSAAGSQGWVAPIAASGSITVTDAVTLHSQAQKPSFTITATDGTVIKLSQNNQQTTSTDTNNPTYQKHTTCSTAATNMATALNANSKLTATAASTAATATFTFTDKPNEGSTITLVGTAANITFEIDNENDGVTGSNVALNGIAAAGGGATGTAADLVAKINAHNGLSITATNPSAGVVLLTQNAGGSHLNTAITLNDASHWNTCTSVNVPSAFTGGKSVVTITQVTPGIAGNRTIIEDYGGIADRIEGVDTVPIQGGQEAITQTPNWESGSYHHFRGNLVMPFNVISSSANDVNEGYTVLINQDLTVWGGGTGVGHSTDAGIYVNKRSRPYGTHHNTAGDSDDQSGHSNPTELGGLGRGVNLVNLHTDTYGEDKEVPMQGPFTEKYVGGRAYRHAEVNDGTDTLGTRQEGWLVLINAAIMTPNGVLHANSGGVGLTGPDYPYPHGPYPFQADDGGGGNSVHWRPIGGRYYRDETAKRPVNIRNIQMVTSSAGHENVGLHRVDVIQANGDDISEWTKHYHEQIATGSARTIIGNYRHNYEVVHTVGRSNQKPFLRDNQSVRNILQTGSFAEAPSILQSTHGQTLVVSRAYGAGTGQMVHEDLLGNGNLPASTHIETILTQKFQSTGSKDFKDTAAAEDEHIVPTLTHLTGAVLVGSRVIVSDVSGGVGGANVDENNNALPARRAASYDILPTPDMHLNMDHRIQDRSSGSTNLNTIFANRFSAPGGPRNQSKGFLDLAAEEYSVYNAYPWRNLEVLGSASGEDHQTRANILPQSVGNYQRLGLRSLRALASGRHGTLSPYVQDTEATDPNTHNNGGIRSADYDTATSWHKVNRNPQTRATPTTEHREVPPRETLRFSDVASVPGKKITIKDPWGHEYVYTLDAGSTADLAGEAHATHDNDPESATYGQASATIGWASSGSQTVKYLAIAESLRRVMRTQISGGLDVNTGHELIAVTKSQVPSSTTVVMTIDWDQIVRRNMGTGEFVWGDRVNDAQYTVESLLMITPVHESSADNVKTATNSRYRSSVSGGLDDVSRISYDNDYVTRPIPQDENQYAWIAASTEPSASGYSLPNLGYGYNMTTFNQPTPSGSRPVDPILFISASQVGSALGNANTHGTSADRGFRYWGIDKGNNEDGGNSTHELQFIPNVHGLNLNLVDSQNTWLTDGSGAVALGFYATGGILPADVSLPIGHTSNNRRGGFAYSSHIANLHSYVNEEIQYTHRQPTDLPNGTVWHGSGRVRVVDSTNAAGDMIELAATPAQNMVYLQGAFVDDTGAAPEAAGGLSRQNEPRGHYASAGEHRMVPMYWSGSNSFAHENVDYSITSGEATSTDHQHYAINQSVAGIFNALMWKRNGPYGYPTWKQVRGGEHQLAQTMRKNNRYVVVDPRSDRVVPPRPGFVGRVVSLSTVETHDVVAAFRRSGHINTAERKHNHYYVPAVETNAKTMLAAIQRGTFDDGSYDPDRILYANVTHVNNLKNFPNSKLNEDVGLRNYKSDRTAYNDLYEMYTEMTDIDGNDAYTLVDLTYRETIYPKPNNAGRSDMRQRSNFDVGYWGGDADAEYHGKTNHTDLHGYHEPIGRRTHFNKPDVRNPHGQWEFGRGPNAAALTVGYLWGGGNTWNAISAFNTKQGYKSTQGISEYHKEKNRNVMWYSGSIWPMDGAKNVNLLPVSYAGAIGPRQYLASSSHRATNPGYAEGFYFDGLAADILTHGAPGILQNQFTWFHNGMSIGFEPTTISSSWSTAAATHGEQHDFNINLRHAVASSSVMSNAAFYALALKVGKIREDAYGAHILTERYVAQPAAGMAFGPSYSRPHMLVGRNSYCSPSAGKAAYARRFNFASETAELTGALSYGKGDGVSPFLEAIKSRGTQDAAPENNGTTIPITSSQTMAGGAPSTLLGLGDRVVSQLTRSIGHEVEGLYVSDWEWKAPIQSGKSPFYTNYSKWFEELRGKSQDRQVIPEYRISDRMPYFVLDKQGRFTSRDREWLSLLGNPSSSGGHLTSSADATKAGDNITGSFISDYAVTATPALLDAIKAENAGITEPYELTLTCDAIVKFLPYQGFYPQLRTVDLCKQFVDSYDDHVTFESDLGINDLASSYVRVDSSGSTNPGSTQDRYGFSPFGPGGGILGLGQAGQTAVMSILFDATQGKGADSSKEGTAEAGYAIPDMTFMVIDDPAAKQRIALVFDRTTTLTGWGNYAHSTSDSTSLIGAPDNDGTTKNDAVDNTDATNADGADPRQSGNVPWGAGKRYGFAEAGTTTNPINTGFEPLGSKKADLLTAGTKVVSTTTNEWVDAQYTQGEFTQVYKVRGGNHYKSTDDNNYKGSLVLLYGVVQAIKHARHNGFINVSPGMPTTTTRRADEDYSPAEPWNPGTYERDALRGKWFQDNKSDINGSTGLSTKSGDNWATVLELKYDAGDGVSADGSDGTAGNGVKVQFFSWNDNNEKNAHPTPASAPTGHSAWNASTSTYDWGNPSTSKAFRHITTADSDTGYGLQDFSSARTFAYGTAAVTTDDALINARFYSDVALSGYSFDVDEILDPTSPRVGGSGKLTDEGFETHGRNPAAAKRPFYGPFMAPGILFNTIKSGVAVDYPVLHRKLATTASVDRDGGRNFQIVNEYFDNRLPFETLVEPERYLTNVPLVDMEPHPSASINATASWDGQGDPLYKMMMHNFLAEIPNFYLADQSMQSFVSLPESDGGFGQVEAVVHNGEKVIPEYRMMVKLFKSQENNIRPLTPSASNHWQNHRGPKLPFKTHAHDGSHSGTLVYNGRYEPCYYTDVIGMENHGHNKDGGYGEGWYPDIYQKGVGINYNKKESQYPRPQSDAPETITMYSRPSAFGPPCAGGYAIEPEYEYIYTGSVAPFSQSYDPDGNLGVTNLNAAAGGEVAYADGGGLLRNNVVVSSSPTVYGRDFGQQFVEGHVAGSGTIGKVADRSMTTYGMKDGTNGYNAPFTPPYYDGQAWAFLTFKPSRTGKHYLDDIWENTTINFLRYEFDYISGAYGDWGTYGPQGYAMNVNAMQIDAAVNIKGKTSIKEVTYDAITGLPQTVQDSLQSTARNSAWVIQTKLETPILHFGYGLTDNQTPLALSGSDSTSTMAESNGYHHGYAGLCEPIGMWHQYGEIPSASQGIYLEVADIPPAYMRFGTEMTIANPKWMHITGSPDMTVGSTAGVMGYFSGSTGELDYRQGAPDWDGWRGSSSFDAALITSDDSEGGDQPALAAGGFAAGGQERFLMGQGYRFSGSFSGSEMAYTVGRGTIQNPDQVRDGTLQRGGRQQYMRWRLMSTGSLAGIIADMTHLQIVSADDGTILDTTWGCPISRGAAATPGISGSGPCFERGYYIDLTVTGSNIISGSLHAGGSGDEDYPAPANQWTSLNRGYPGTSSMRQQLMGIGKLESSFTMHREHDDADTTVKNITIPFRNYYNQWLYDVPNNPVVDKWNLAASYHSPLHKNKRGVIPDPPHFSNNIGTGSFGTALGCSLYSHQYDNTHPYQTKHVGYVRKTFGSEVQPRMGPQFGSARAANGYNSDAIISNSVGVGRAEIICGYTGSEGKYGFDADGKQITGWNASQGNPPPENSPYKWAKSIDGPLSGNVSTLREIKDLDNNSYPVAGAGEYDAALHGRRYRQNGRYPRYPNGNMMASGLTHGETSYQRWASDYYFTGDASTLDPDGKPWSDDTAQTSGSTTTIGVPAGVNGFHGRTGGSGDSACGWFGSGLEDIYPLGQTGYPSPYQNQNGIGIKLQDTSDYTPRNDGEMVMLDPIKMWYTNPVHIANVRMQDMFVRDKMMSNNPKRAHKVLRYFQDLEAALCSPRTVPSGKFQPRGGAQALTRSLGSLVGFESGAKKLGQLAEVKTVKEAVVVMPYVMRRGRRRFIELDKAQINRYFGRGDFKDTAYWAAIEKFKNLEGLAASPISGLQVNLGNSILRQIRIMGDYVMPPHLDFTRTPSAKPYAMYIFEYEHQFSAQDLSDMWQGLFPDSGKTMKQVTKQVTHKLNIAELLGASAEDGEALPDQIRFMVFKVKQRAEINYFKQTKNQLDDQRFRFKFKAGAAAKTVDYSYNWPYDFFSLVETAKIDMSVMLRNKTLIEDIELQELNERFSLEPVVTSVSDLFRRRVGVMSRMSITAASIRRARRLATRRMATAAVAATYGPVTVSTAPSPSPSLAGPTLVAPAPFGGSS